MGQSLIIQGIVSKFHFHVNNSNYLIKHMTRKLGGGAQQIRCMDINRVFSHDVTAAILVSQNGPVGVELFSYADAFFCSNKFA